MQLFQFLKTSDMNDNSKLPRGISVFAWARSMRWIGWGFGEALIPVFIYHFSKTFAETGLLGTIVNITSLISLPVIGVLVDKKSAKRMILLSLLLYPIVGISYFLAGSYGLTAFIVIAGAVNGFTWEMENIGIATYCRRVVDHKRIATSFGYIDTCSHVGWIAAALSGMLLVLYMPIYYLLLGIAPFALLAYFIALRAPEDSVTEEHQHKEAAFFNAFGKALSEWRTWDSELWFLGVLIFFEETVSALIWFFVPIDAYLAGANLSMIILLGILGAIPALFGYQLGKIADSGNKYTLIFCGLLGVAVILVGLAVFPQYWVKLLASIFLGIILEMFTIIQSSLITTLGPSKTYGQRGSVFEGILTLGDLSAPLILGIALDVMGFYNVVISVAVMALVLCLGYRLMRASKRKAI
jgi:MFS family permease